MLEVWVLTICIQGYALCTGRIQLNYPTSKDCNIGLAMALESKDAEHFKFINCAPKKIRVQIG